MSTRPATPRRNHDLVPIPNPHPEPRIAYHHPLLDSKFGIASDDNSSVWTDPELDALIGRYIESAKVAHRAGFQFVDVKQCHRYLLNELLSARSRPGRRRRLPDSGHRGRRRHCHNEKEAPLLNHGSCPVHARQASVKKNAPVRELFFAAAAQASA